ncbi:pyruvate-flavodoxin oxidoreductase [Citrobacter freundii]|nr:pyruvate-flavodoxin oxidoreductase [Citrobacter freundii]
MGSAIGTCEEVVEELLARGEKVGVLKVRLFRPFSAKHLLRALPETVRSIAVLDRTKEPGAQAEPLYLDVMTALAEAFNCGERETLPRVIGGRYGLSSKEFGPDCVMAVFTELSSAKPKPRFTVGIYDDVTNLSLPLPENTLPVPRSSKRCSTVWAVTAACRPPKIISRLSVTRRRGMRRVISCMTRKKQAV